ncbi:MAG: hypothetical protein SOY64_10635 [Pyramidobacter sp.]|nr:hypothetical protein [Pyramidobacter sp.]
MLEKRPPQEHVKKQKKPTDRVEKARGRSQKTAAALFCDALERPSRETSTSFQEIFFMRERRKRF